MEWSIWQTMQIKSLRFDLAFGIGIPDFLPAVHVHAAHGCSIVFRPFTIVRLVGVQPYLDMPKADSKLDAAYARTIGYLLNLVPARLLQPLALQLGHLVPDFSSFQN